MGTKEVKQENVKSLKHRKNLKKKQISTTIKITKNAVKNYGFDGGLQEIEITDLYTNKSLLEVLPNIFTSDTF